MASEPTIQSCDSLFWQLSTDNNMEVYYQVKHKLRAPTLHRKFEFSHWFLCGADGKSTYGHVINKISLMDKLPKFF